MRILRENTTAIIIDVQERLYPHMSGNEMLAGKITTLIEGLKILDIPVIAAQQYPKGLGPTIPAVKEALGGCPVFDKLSFSCCGEGAFTEEFSRLGKKYAVIAGIEAHVCVLQTVVDLLEMGFVPVLVEDCISSRSERDKQVAVERMKSEGAIVTTCESILFELCRCAGTDTFKAISKLVK